MITSGMRPEMTALGPVRVRLASVVQGSADGHQSINSPKTAEAVAQLRRVAQVTGAEDIIHISSDYHRAEIAAGPLTTQWRIVVEAYGTAVSRVAPAEPAPKETEAGASPDA